MTYCAIREFFGAQHNTLTKDSNHCPGKSTRCPGDFDIHLAPEQRLKRIVCVPDMADGFLGVAEECLKNPQLRLPPSVEDVANFPNPDNRSSAMKRARVWKAIRRESDIQDVYDRSVSKFCSVIAAQLYPGQLYRDQPNWDSAALSWTTSSVPPSHVRRPSSSPRKPKASGRTSKSDKQRRANNSAALNAPQRSVTPQARASSSRSKLRAPAPSKMLDKPKQATKPLADGYLWLNSKCEATELSSCLAIYEFKSMATADLEKMAEMAYGFHDGKEFEGDECKMFDGCLLHHHDSSVQRRKMGPDALHCVSHAIQDVIDGAKPVLTSPEYENFKKSGRTVSGKVKDMIQQIWGEACYNDVTFIVFNAGNCEILGIRHRSSQTLFLSEIIDVPRANYYKLHTGLYLAAIGDLIQRWERLRNESPPTTYTDEDIQVDWRGVIPSSETHFLELVRKQIKSRPWLSLQMATEGTTFEPFRAREPYYQVADIAGVHWQDPHPPITEETSFWITFRTSFEGTRVNKGVINFPKMALPDGVPELPAVTVRVAEGEDGTEALRVEWELVSSAPDLVGRLCEYYEHKAYATESDSQTTYTPAAVLVMDDPRKSVAEWCSELHTTPDTFVTHQQWLGFYKALEELRHKGWHFGRLETCHLAINGEYDSPDVSLFNLSGFIFRNWQGFQSQSHHELAQIVENPAVREAEISPEPEDLMHRPAKRVAFNLSSE